MKTDSVVFAKALADLTRQEIMKITCCKWMNVSEIVEKVGTAQSTVSHHLAILKEANLVLTRQEGKHTYYQLNQENIAFCCGNLIQIFAPQISDANITGDTNESDCKRI